MKRTIHANGTPFCNEPATALCTGRKSPVSLTSYNPAKVTCVACLRLIAKMSASWIKQIVSAVLLPPKENKGKRSA